MRRSATRAFGWALAASALAAPASGAPRRRAAPEATAPRCDVLFSPRGGPGALRAAISREIRSARAGLDIALYAGMTADLARDVALSSRAARVRVIVDEGSLAADPDDPGGGPARWLRILADAGVEVRTMRIAGLPEDRRPAFHHKFAVIDGATVLTGSYNWSARGDGLNYENLVVIRDGAVGARYRDEFARLWGKATVVE